MFLNNQMLTIFSKIFGNLKNKEIYNNIFNDIQKNKYNLNDIFDKYHEKLNWDDLMQALKYIPESIIIKYLNYFIYNNTYFKFFVTNVIITEKLIFSIENTILDQNIKNNFWHFVSINPSFPLMYNFEIYVSRVAYNRFAYNINFPMDIDFIERNIQNINILDLLKHNFLTNEVKEHILNKYINI